ncbi:MAG: CvpA family protein [Patescibacteria group bacterium]|jgi:membrane protein required for colicin V production
MSLVDIILLVLVGAFAFYGLWFGFIRILGNGVGLIVGAIVASQYTGLAIDYLGFLFANNTTVAGIVLFILILIVTQRLVGFVFWIVDRLFGFLRWLPFVGFVNKLLGGILGLIEGLVLVGAAVYFAQLMFPTLIGGWFSGSQVVSYINSVTSAIQTMIPWI